jgi:hypothetical protein
MVFRPASVLLLAQVSMDGSTQMVNIAKCLSISAMLTGLASISTGLWLSGTYSRLRGAVAWQAVS